jgi:TRAP-type C4-dicarboxylate transport system substrate-binding protein
VSIGRYEKLSPEERKILRRAGVALSELADARRAFNQLDSEKLRKEAEVPVKPVATSPWRGFKVDWTSAGS